MKLSDTKDPFTTLPIDIATKNRRNGRISMFTTRHLNLLTESFRHCFGRAVTGNGVTIVL